MKTEKEKLEFKLHLAREKGRKSATFKSLLELANKAKGHEINVLRNFKFDPPLSEEIKSARKSDSSNRH